MADLSQPNNPLYNPDDHLVRLLCDDIEAPWYKTFVQNVKEMINPPKLPPLEVTSRPVAVKDIWGLYGRQKKSFFMSTGVQGVILLLLIAAFSNKAVQQQVKQVATLIAPIDIAPYQPKAAPKKDLMVVAAAAATGRPCRPARASCPSSLCASSPRPWRW